MGEGRVLEAAPWRGRGQEVRWWERRGRRGPGRRVWGGAVGDPTARLALRRQEEGLEGAVQAVVHPVCWDAGPPGALGSLPWSSGARGPPTNSPLTRSPGGEGWQVGARHQ
jgi:hypothetical protein